MAGTLDRRVTAARPDLAALALRGQVEATRFCAGTRHVVRQGAVPVRRHPAPDAPLDTQALFGEAITVFDEEEGWAWGQLEADGYVGYLPAAGLEAAPVASSGLIVRVPRTFVYPAPDLKTPPLDALPLGARVAATREGGAFVRTPGGFVYAAHLADPAGPAPDWVEVAERFLHAPYLWGGKTWEGIDCSGLVQVTLGAAGVVAPRDSDMLRALGTPLREGADRKRGDLVFWAGHVGILRDAGTLLHSDGFHMQVVSEPLADARRRIGATPGGDIWGFTRPIG